MRPLTDGIKWSSLVAICLFATHAPAAVVIDWATIGDPGNAPDARLQSDGTSGYGAVSAAFGISKYEVTNAQYADYLNAKDPTGANSLGLYDSRMSTDGIGGINYSAGAASGSKYTVKAGRGSKPVVHVSWYDTLRFANWLHNGQGTGSTETGAYTLLGGTETPSNGPSITRNANAKVFLPSENEWYKAAYYKGGGSNAGYWMYATQTDSVPSSIPPAGGTNSANYIGDTNGFAVTQSFAFNASQDYLTDAGAYGASSSVYGTFDQNGNAYEWTDTLISGSIPGVRGGSWDDISVSMRAIQRDYRTDAFNSFGDLGFRVATAPEPAGLSILLAGGVLLLRRRPS